MRKFIYDDMYYNNIDVFPTNKLNDAELEELYGRHINYRLYH